MRNEVQHVMDMLDMSSLNKLEQNVIRRIALRNVGVLYDNHRRF